MTPKRLAKTLAYSLTRGHWTRPALEHALRQRLPRTLDRLAPDFAVFLTDHFSQFYAPTAGDVGRALKDAPGFDVLLKYCLCHEVWPELDQRPPEMATLPFFESLEVPQLVTPGDLADWLCLDLQRLDYFADRQSRFEAHGDAAVNHYRYILRKKAGGGMRIIEAPKQILKSLQRAILRGIVERIPDHGSAYGFVPGRNCLDAAQQHVGEPVVVRFDLQDFFPSIHAGRVLGLFRSLGYPQAVASYLIGFCVTRTPAWVLERLPVTDRAAYRETHLPQGSPVSPALANKLAFALDRRLSALARRSEATYTRYADDLTFSGERRITKILLQAVPEIVREEGFRLNHEKTRVMRATSRQTVTGVVVNDRMNVSRPAFDRLKAIIHACGKPGDARLHDASFRAQLLGQIGWIEQVNPHRGHKLRCLLEAAYERSQKNAAR